MSDKNTPYWVSHRIARKGLSFDLGPTCGGGWSWSLEARGREFNTLIFSEDYTTKAAARRGRDRFIAAVSMAALEEDRS
jgi:hypothetical protein